MIKGNDLIIKLGGTAIAMCKSCDINTDVEVVETTSANDGGWKHYRASYKSWGVSVSKLVTSASTDLLMAGQTYTLTAEVRGTSDTVQGTAILKTCRITGTRGNLAQGSFTFQGSGALSVVSSALT